ncbi:MAG: flagellar biosynthetic protein FliR [Oceanococcus sp.]
MFAMDDIALATTPYLWAFLRVGALWMALPIFGSGVLSGRMRLVLAWACTLVVAPLMPELNLPDLWSARWFLAIVQELALGLLMAFSLALIFEMVRLSAEIIGLGMGLGFAQMTDPLNGSSAPVLGQYFSILAILLFLAGGGHLQIVQWLAMSLIHQPPGQLMLESAQVLAPVLWASVLFIGAVQIALPAIIALLLLNLSFGVISRAAPALNLFAIGFPASLLLGLVMVLLTLPTMQSLFTSALNEAFVRLSMTYV